MDVTIEELSGFMAFTYLFRYCRPNHEDFFVYEVDSGKPSDYNIVITAGKIVDGDMSDPMTIMISKEWVLENLDKILKNVEERANTG